MNLNGEIIYPILTCLRLSSCYCCDNGGVWTNLRTPRLFRRIPATFHQHSIRVTLLTMAWADNHLVFFAFAGI